VTTGVCLVGAVARKAARHSAERPRAEKEELRTTSETTLVSMSELSDAEIRGYVANGEPMDKAGHMQFREWLRGGFRALKEITAT